MNIEPSTSSGSSWKYIGITAATGAAVGVFLHFARKDDRTIVEIERLQMMVDVLGAKIEDLETVIKNLTEDLKQKGGMRTSNSGGALKSVSFRLEAARAQPITYKREMARTRSWTSITSDSEYGDAEEDWYGTSKVDQRSSQSSWNR
ncbi:hypothetical protein L3Y34_008973 [Caenorhabditis briggsae]|uniref:Uncharacterized protein n=1 Tax=Caenorhabditis briggsae TaxID=6238 RepID=A0AAE9D1D3_CAEBR|nr:hypothetical protein L3Y34_008973 [Caenorhabditis briggsae]